MMQNKVVAEGKKAKELYDKFMCYCENSDATLGKSISDAETKIPQLESAIKEGGALMEQLKAEIEQAKTDRAEAKEAIAKATALRDKEASAFASESSMLKSNIDALGKAIPAIEKGMAGAFLQTAAATVLRRLSMSMDMNSVDRDMLASFLSMNSHEGYVPQSGEILGILKQMKDEMEKDLATAEAEEASAIADYESLVAAKNKEIDACTAAIESKLTRVAELGVELATQKNDLEDTIEALGEDKKFLADLDKNCESKKKEWAEYTKMQSMELTALAETIKILNDDDALEIFKKTLPSASLLQVKVSERDTRMQALHILRSMRTAPGVNPRLDLLEMALHGKKIGFEKVIKMIDDLIALLAKEQLEDDKKKEWCTSELDSMDDKKKALEHDISDLEKAIADAGETIATLKSEIEALEDAIKALDKSVEDATEQRKAEHAEFVETTAANNVAKDLIGFAKNRMNKFYNPKLYKPPPKRELSEEERITTNMGGTLAPTDAPGGIAGTGIGLISEHQQEAPPPPPEANLAYKNKGQGSGGVIAMMDLLIADLDKENTEMEVTEKDAQGDYEKFMADAASQRAEDSKAITDKEASKASLEEEMEVNKASLKDNQMALMETEKAIMELHQECDWLLSKFDLRKEARAGEVEALKKAKAVLSGADFSM